jgi:hypothetical protein
MRTTSPHLMLARCARSCSIESSTRTPLPVTLPVVPKFYQFGQQKCEAVPGLTSLCVAALLYHGSGIDSEYQCPNPPAGISACVYGAISLLVGDEPLMNWNQICDEALAVRISDPLPMHQSPRARSKSGHPPLRRSLRLCCVSAHAAHVTAPS